MVRINGEGNESDVIGISLELNTQGQIVRWSTHRKI